MSLLKSAATVGGYTMISRLLGFLRDILIAAILGAGPVADAFFVAFKIPNFFRRLFAEGAFNAAFVPSFSGLLVGAGRKAAQAFAEDVLAVLLTVLVVFLIVAEIAMPWLMAGIAPGFVGEPEQFDLAVTLTRLTFPYLLFVSLVSLMGGVLNSLDRFAAAAAAPILLNLCLIAALLGLAPLTETPAHALAWGVAVAGMAQFVWLALACRNAGMALALPRPRLTPQVRAMLLLMAPAALGAGVAQLNVLADTIIATLLPTGAVSYLYYADRVTQLPLGVIGVALGTALLPRLSRRIRDGDETGAGADQNRAIEAALLFTLPAAAALVAVAYPIVAVLFERGAFGPAETRATALAMAAYAAGLPAYVLIKVLVPGYFARRDTRTPLRIAALCLIVNVVLNLILMQPLGHVGIALASAVASWLNAALLLRGLAARDRFHPDLRLRQRLPKMLLATAAMAAVLWLTAAALTGPLAGGLAERAAALAALVAVGMVAFAAAAAITGAAQPREVAQVFRRGS